MQKKIKYMTIIYSDLDKEYIDELCDKINIISQEIVDFFEIEETIDVKVNIFDSLDLFKNKFWEIFGYNCKTWTCGFAYSYNNDQLIDTLTLSEYRKTFSHENHNLNDLIYLILHEFVHSCHQIVTHNKLYVWLKEGLATYLSHQYDNFVSKPINGSLDNMKNGDCSYHNYFQMMKYTINLYGKYFVFDLINDENVMIKETPRLYKEAKKFYGNK